MEKHFQSKARINNLNFTSSLANKQKENTPATVVAHEKLTCK